MERSKDTAVVLARPLFEGIEVTVLEVDGRPVWSPRQLAEVLGYVDDDRIVINVTGQWSGDLVDSLDYMVLRGPELAAVKAAGLADPRAPSLMLLTESGVYLVAMLSRQGKARAFRRWLADEVLPSIRKTGGYRPEVIRSIEAAREVPAVLGVHQFDEQAITVRRVNGRRAFSVAEIAGALGYTDGGAKFAAWIYRRFDLLRGADFEVLKDDDYIHFGFASAESAQAMVLYDSGLHTALCCTKKLRGHRLHRWLVDEVLPAAELAQVAALVRTVQSPDHRQIEAPVEPPVSVVEAARNGLALLHARFPASTIKAAIGADTGLGEPGKARARLAPQVAAELVNTLDPDWGRLLATLAAGDDEAEQIARALWDVNAVFWLPGDQLAAADLAVFGSA